MKFFFMFLLVIFLPRVNFAYAQGPYASYEIEGQEWLLFGYYVSSGRQPHFLAVFRPRKGQSPDFEQFGFKLACEAVLASPPDIDGVPVIEPTGGVIFFQVIQTQKPGFPTVVSNYTEFDVKGAECFQAEPNSIYTPRPGFTPGISN